MKQVTIFTDGACSYNPGPGGWACILIYGGHQKEISGYMPETTNNRMEIFAVIQGLRALKEPCSVSVFSDSAYVINAFKQGWIDRWQRSGWKTAAKKPVENQDLWNQLLIVMQKHQLSWNKVAGHSDVELNERCDQLARGQVEQYIRQSKTQDFVPLGKE